MLTQWLCLDRLTSGASITLMQGFYPDMTPYFAFTDCSQKTFATWAIITEKAGIFMIQGALDGNSGVFDTLLTVTLTGGVLSTPYNLAAPYNNTGVFVLTRPIIRFILADDATADHTYTRAYVKAW